MFLTLPLKEYLSCEKEKSNDLKEIAKRGVGALVYLKVRCFVIRCPSFSLSFFFLPLSALLSPPQSRVANLQLGARVGWEREGENGGVGCIHGYQTS